MAACYERECARWRPRPRAPPAAAQLTADKRAKADESRQAEDEKTRPTNGVRARPPFARGDRHSRARPRLRAAAPIQTTGARRAPKQLNSEIFVCITQAMFARIVAILSDDAIAEITTCVVIGCLARCRRRPAGRVDAHARVCASERAALDHDRWHPRGVSVLVMRKMMMTKIVVLTFTPEKPRAPKNAAHAQLCAAYFETRRSRARVRE